MLTALAVGLGGSARVTNRGKSLGSLVQNGKSSALVRIVLNNQYSDAYNHSQYGDQIQIERRILADGGGTFTVKSQSGKIVSKKRETLNEITDHFNLQVDNPCSILTQDAARSFLLGKPDAKYQFFMDGTQLNRMESNFVRIDEHITKMALSLKAKESSLPEMEKKLKALEVEKKRAIKLQNGRDELVALKHKLTWAIVCEKEATVTTLKGKLEALDAQVAKKESKQAKIAGMKSKLEEDFETTQTSIKDVSTRLGAVQEKIRACEQKRSEVTREQTKLNAEYRDCEKRIAPLKNRKNKFQEQLRTTKETEESEKRKEQEAREKIVNEKQEKLKSLEEKLKSITENQEKNNAAKTDQKKVIYDTDQEMAKAQQESSEFRNSLKKAQEQSQNRANNFGESTETIHKLLDVNKNQFTQPPIGPLGYYVTVKEQKWEKAVETALGAAMFAYIVNTHEDRTKFTQIMEANRIRVPVVLTVKFSNAVFDDITPLAFPVTVLNSIQSKHPMVINTLIDQTYIEKIALVEGDTDTQAWQLIRTDAQSARNLHSVIRMDGVKYSLRGKAEIRDNSQHGKPAKHLTTNQDEKINYYKVNMERRAEQLKHLNVKKTELNAKLRELDTKIQRDNDSITAIRREMSDLTRQIASHQLQGVEEDTSQLRQDWEKSIALIDEEIEGLQEKLKEIKSKIAEISQKEEPIQNEIETLQGEAATISEENADIEQGIEKYRHAKAKLVAMDKELEKTITAQKAGLEAGRAQLSELTAELDADIEKAGSICARIEVDEPADKIKRKIDSIAQFLEKEERGQRPVADIKKDYEGCKTRVEQVKAQLRALNDLKQRVQQNLADRRHVWAFQCNSLAQRTRESFTILLTQKGFHGNLLFDHSAKRLQIEVRPTANASNKDTSALSGGEKSFSTTCLLMSIWQVMETPLCAMDEFDVFMDGAVRKKSIDLLVQLGLSAAQKETQFLFLSPGDKKQVPSAKKGEIAVFEMAEPRG